MHTCTYIIMSLEGVCLSSRGLCPGFVWGFLSGRFCPGWGLSVPLLAEYIRCNRKLSITFNFRFQVYENVFKSVTSHALLLPPLSQTVTPSRTPSSVTYFMDGPNLLLSLNVYLGHSPILSRIYNCTKHGNRRILSF